MKKIVILGSARNDGNAKNLSKLLIEKSKWDLINLNDYKIGHFDYQYQNRDDDYLNLIRKIVTKYETLILVTPVYWFSMSGVMKVFFDRFTDLLTIEKELGRKLRGKKMAVLTTSIGKNLEESFWLPFSETAKYLGMQYIGNMHTLVGEEKENDIKINKFIALIER